MTEHEQNLHDLYAGLAMVGWLINGDEHPARIPMLAHEMAAAMIKERANAKDEAAPAPDVAVSDMEGREDSDTKGIAALKKTRTRHKSV